MAPTRLARLLAPGGEYPLLWGDTVAAARERKGLTQTQLAAAIGVNKTTILRIENGDRGGNDLTRCLIAQALGVSVCDLFPMPA